MARTGKKELRIQLSEQLHSYIMTAAAARGMTPAAFVSELVMSTLELGPTVKVMGSHVNAMKEMQTMLKSIRDDVRVSRDFIADLYAAESE